MEALLVLLAFALFIGVLGGMMAVIVIPNLRRANQELHQALNRQSHRLDDLHREVDGLRRRMSAGADTQPTEQIEPDKTDEQEPRSAALSTKEQLESAKADSPADESAATTLPEPAVYAERQPTAADGLAENVKENWMIWLGGLCVALAGIFLVRYSIEQGLLGPTARVVGGLLLGASLHGGAEYLRRKMREQHPSFAALAGAGSITLYASLLAALRLYDLIQPGTAFLGMAVVAFATMAMAYLHGPVLAAFGILGAYLVPVLVSSDSGAVVIAMIYALIVSASALLLLRYVYRDWLYGGMLVGALGWWLITFANGDVDAFRPYYLAILLYMLFAVPTFDWPLKARIRLPDASYDLQQLWRLEPEAERYSMFASMLVVAALGLSILFTTNYDSPWYALLPMALALFVGQTRESMNWLPWLTFIVVLFAWFVPQLTPTAEGWSIEQLSGNTLLTFLYFLLAMSALTSGVTLWLGQQSRFPLLVNSLATLAPVLAMSMGYLLGSHLVKSWYWGLSTALLAMSYLVVATRSRQTATSGSLVVWLFVGGHFALALAAAMIFAAGTLTLALALQIVSIAWLIQKFDLPDLDWLLKLVIGTVVVRLTINPWLVDYPPEFYWPLWTYGGSTLCALAGIRLLKEYPGIAKWAEGAALHLFVLTIWAVLRYQLYDGAVFESEFSFTEAVINISLFGSLSLVYYRRSLVSESLQKLYVVFSYLLAALALFSYGLIGVSTLVSDAWVWSAVGETPIFNMLLAAYGVPILLGYLFARFHDPNYRKQALGFSGLAAFIFISLQIRHLWEGTIRFFDPPTSAAELYSYSVVWLILAVGAILGGTWRYGQDVYRAGMILLVVVIAKLFLIDMSDLEGLLRVASFMGLGMSLLGISYLYQKLQQGREDATGSVSRR
ncbi:MAG: DUF2339 domain-containing protein [Pseudomonadales bacterium]|nr:DUF2339 domain-containing protein [Pseudomonadales bacterium]